MSARFNDSGTKSTRASRASGGRLLLIGWSSLALIGACAVAACGSAVDVTPSGSGFTTAQVPGTMSSSGGTGGSGPAGDGLPCDIATILANSCIACHSSPPVGGAPSSLLTYAELTAPSVSDPSKTEAEMALSRMQDAAKPMPPAPAAGVPAADVAAFQAWVTSGTPKGSCGGVDAGPNPFNDPPTCTSGTYWDQQSADNYMAPGDACIACHSQGEGPSFSVAGTVYASGHEKQWCNAQALPGEPAISTAIVEITGADNTVIPLTVNSVGNFSRRSSKTPALVKPYTVKLKYNGKERVMVTPQTDGDCNKCHTQNGSGKPAAPGRIALP